MKTRIITAFIALIPFFISLFLIETYIFNILISFICMISIWEIFTSINSIKNNKFLIIMPIIFSGIFPFLNSILAEYSNIVYILYIIYFVLTIIFNINKIDINKFSFCFIMSIIIPLFFSYAIYIRDYTDKYYFYYIFIAVSSAWISDTFAYFGGYFFGKRKIVPKISPNKTLEGFISGIIGNILFGFIFSYFYALYYLHNNINVDINYVNLFIILTILSIAGIFGDLFASAIKRINNIKDFGKIMPGHGGIFDRFDSILFTVPLVYYLIKIFNVIV
ncbi:MAG: phosphatidate cytidylyltransferase [Oscillospiraceae bacterium]|nr:phosphatidate cytidylyltransferase [Oscillospiraceae bacterium]